MTATTRVVIDVSGLFRETGTAKLAELPAYLRTAREAAGTGNEVVLTGPGPVWLYLSIGHALHGLARTLRYDSPATGEITIFNHDPF